MRVLFFVLVASASARILGHAHSAGGRPALRALRGGAIEQPLMWARHADNGTAVVLVRSLAAFCEEHDLDEDEMLAVSRGESDMHKGWECGSTQAYDAPEEETIEAVAADAADEAETVQAEEVEDEEDTDEGSEAAARPPPPPAQMNKMIAGMVAPMLAVQVLKRFDQTAPTFVPSLRIFYFSIVALNVLVQLYLQWRIRATNDESLVATPPNPLAMLMGGSNNAKASTTAMEYDVGQLKSLRTSYQMGCLFNMFLHFKFKMTQPLVYSSISGLVDLFYNPLVQIHLLLRCGREGWLGGVVGRGGWEGWPRLGLAAFTCH